ncbi:hypothetical protein BDR04DRAFT_1153923 [Suillus decipiens]|nr:hypothetical protein BDR04DRAFT_1153923 [Suillus decipiens]
MTIFDATNTLHLIMASAAGSLILEDFSKNGIVDNEGLKVQLEESKEYTHRAMAVDSYTPFLLLSMSHRALEAFQPRRPLVGAKILSEQRHIADVSANMRTQESVSLSGSVWLAVKKR